LGTRRIPKLGSSEMRDACADLRSALTALTALAALLTALTALLTTLAALALVAPAPLAAQVVVLVLTSASHLAATHAALTTTTLLLTLTSLALFAIQAILILTLSHDTLLRSSSLHPPTSRGLAHCFSNRHASQRHFESRSRRSAHRVFLERDIEPR
jgi:hypothetical protein